MAALNHKPVDRVPFDFGGTVLSGAHVSIIDKIRKFLGLSTNPPVKVWEPAQMLGEVAHDLQEFLEVDVLPLPMPKNVFGFANENCKKWKTFDGTDVQVPGLFKTEPAEDGSIYMYPQGDITAGPSAKMPKGGFYFDAIIRQKAIDDAKLNPEDNLEEFQLLSDEELEIWRKNAETLYSSTDCAIASGLPGTAFGDVFLVPAPFLKDPKGIRDIEEWYISTICRKGYILEVFDRQADIAIKNMEMIYQAVGDKIQVAYICGTNLAAQNTLFCSPETYLELYHPFYARVNNWIHKNTAWKTMKHCCGACEPLIGEFIKSGFDILNPVQCSAEGMDPEILIEKYGDDIVFWGGGVDTQQTLPFGTPEEVSKEVQDRIIIFQRKNGFIFATIHNVQCNMPVENMIAIFKALGRNI